MDLFKPIWSNEIQKEWISNLLQNRTDLKRKALVKAKNAMNAAFPLANISNYERFLNRVELPDQNDCHILAAAIQGKADLIITFNLKDFPSQNLKRYGLESMHPDDFIAGIIQSNPYKAREALANQISCLINPPKSTAEVLEMLEKCALGKSAKLLKD